MEGYIFGVSAAGNTSAGGAVNLLPTSAGRRVPLRAALVAVIRGRRTWAAEGGGAGCPSICVEGTHLPALSPGWLRVGMLVTVEVPGTGEALGRPRMSRGFHGRRGRTRHAGKR